MVSRRSATKLNPAISADVADWSRERPRSFWDPSRKLLGAIRSYQAYANRRGPVAVLGRKISLLRHRFWTVVTGADIPVNVKIAGGLLLPHPNGVVIHPDAVIGPNCLIFQQVTLGTGGPTPGTPTLGGHVDVGAGAKILGGVTLGPHAKVGANAVVLQDVPPHVTAVGVPAKFVYRNH